VVDLQRPSARVGRGDKQIGVVCVFQY